MKYYLHYVENCKPKVFIGDTESDLEHFVNEFVKKHGSVDDGMDNCIELDKIYKGQRLEMIGV